MRETSRLDELTHEMNRYHWNILGLCTLHHGAEALLVKTPSFPGADIGSDHNLVMMSFKLHLKRIRKQGHTRIKFDLEKLKDPKTAEVFPAMIGGKFPALNILDADGTNIDTGG